MRLEVLIRVKQVELSLGEKYIKNLPIVKMSNPFPASSSIYNQKV